MNWEKRFPLGKDGILNPLHWKFCAYHRIFDFRKGPANTLTPLTPNVSHANINSNRKP